MRMKCRSAWLQKPYQGSPWGLDCRSRPTELRVVTQKQMEVAHWDCSDVWNSPSRPSFVTLLWWPSQTSHFFFLKVGDEWMNESLLGRVRICLLSAHGRYGSHGRYGPIQTPSSPKRTHCGEHGWQMLRLSHFQLHCVTAPNQWVSTEGHQSWAGPFLSLMGTSNGQLLLGDSLLA